MAQKKKCYECLEGELKSRIESYEYTNMGIPVVLHGVIVERCTDCISWGVEIPEIKKLQEAMYREDYSGVSKIEATWLSNSWDVKTLFK